VNEVFQPPKSVICVASQPAQRRAATQIGMINSQHSWAMIGAARYATG
jgi:hypothetical protein